MDSVAGRSTHWTFATHRSTGSLLRVLSAVALTEDPGIPGNIVIETKWRLVAVVPLWRKPYFHGHDAQLSRE